MDKIEVGKAIRGYFREKRISQVDVAKKFGVSTTYVSQLLNGRKAFGEKHAQMWHDEFGFRRTWLMTGEGMMFEDKQSSDVIFEGLIKRVNEQEASIAELKEECVKMMKVLTETCEKLGVKFPID